MLSLATNALPDVTGWHVLVRLSVAAGLGGAIGIERELREREAGIRTHILVALGSALFTLVSAYGFHDFLTSGSTIVRTDPTRIAAQIVTGIGFLGAGAIIREGLSVRGLTTAGSLWVVAAIGMASAAGYWWAAVATTGITLFALGPLRSVAYHVIERVRPEENRIIVELRAGQPVGPFLAELHDVKHFELSEERDRRIVQLELDDVDEALVSRISDLDYVLGVRWRR